MSELGNRLRRELDTVAPPADLSQIVLHEPALPLWRIGRAFAIVSVTTAVVGLTVVLLSRGDRETAADSSPPTQATTAAPSEPPTTSTTTTVDALEIALVPPAEWPQSALDPVFALPECEVNDVGDFIHEEFPDLEELATTAASGTEIADVLPLPRLGLESVFTEDSSGWCFSAGTVADVTAWTLQGPQAEQTVYAAARPRESNSVPENVIDEYYHQSRIASGHGFNVSVRPEGRAVGVIEHDSFVLVGTGLEPTDDVFIWGEQFAMSLYKAPFVVDRRGGPLAGGLFDPTGLPSGYGPCMISWLVWEQSGDGAEWHRAAYCDSDGNYIETLFGFGGDYPPTPDGADEWDDVPFSGWTWTAEGRHNIAFDIDERRSASVWVTGPDSLDPELLSAVTRSMLVFRPELISPRKGDASFAAADDSEAAVQGLTAEAVGAGPNGLTIHVNQWPDDGGNGTMLSNALALGANRVERLDEIDVIAADTGDGVQAVFSCGGLWFNISFQPDPPNERPDPEWSQDRYQSILDWLFELERTLGCITTIAER